MSTTLLTVGKALNRAFAKASMLAKLAMCFNMALAYFVLLLYKEGLTLNNKILMCHEARVKDLTAVLQRVSGIDVKVRENAEELQEIKAEKIGYYEHSR